MKFYIAACLTFLLFSSFLLGVQDTPLKFDSFSVSDGLSQSEITSIAQDSLGFIWFGTKNGLNKFDGYRFTTYKHETNNPTSLSNSVVTSIDVDKDGKVWVGTIDGLNIYNSQTDSFNRVFEDGYGRHIFQNKDITFIQSLPNGEQWIGVSNMICRNTRGNLFEVYTIDYERAILSRLSKTFCISEASPSTLWVGDSYGLYLFDKEKTTFRQILPQLRDANTLPLKVFDIHKITETKNLLLATSNGLFVYNYREDSLREINYKGKSLSSVNQIKTDQQGNIWIATRAKGLFIFKDDVLHQYQYVFKHKTPLMSNRLTKLFVDRSNNLWLGTELHGANMASLNKPDYTLLAYQFQDVDALSDNIVRSVLAEGDSVVWVGTEYGVLNKFEKKEGTVQRFKIPSSENNKSGGLPHIVDIKRGAANRLLIASGSGLFFFDEQKKTFTQVDIALDKKNTQHKYQNRINGVMIDSDSNVWCSYPIGIIILQKEKENIASTTYNLKTPGALININTQVIYQDKRDNIWIGTQASGLILYTGSIDKHSFRHYGADGELFKSNNVSALFEDSQNRFWIGTWGGGLSLFDRDSGKVISYSTISGLLDNTIFSITEDTKGCLWISTYEGLTCFDVEANKFEQYRFRDNKDILEINYGADDIDSDNTMYLGTNEGLIMYKTDNQQTESYYDDIVLTSLTVNGKIMGINESANREEPVITESIVTTPEIILSHKDRHFSIGFTDFNSQHTYKENFSYMMDGFDEDWIRTSETYASYTNLSPGTYTFKIQSINRYGHPVGNITALKVYIKPPFWSTGYAYIIYLLLLMGAIYLLYRYFAMRNQEKQIFIQKEAERELYQAKMKFFTNVSHEIRTPLTLILGPINRIKEALKEDAILSKQVDMMNSNGDRLLRMVNQLLNLRKIELGEMKVYLKPVEFVSFVKKVCAYFDDICLRNNIAMSIHSAPVEFGCQIDEDKVEKILYNIFSNAIKYTRSYISVFIDVDNHSEKEMIIIKIKDDGKGISKSETEKIFHRFFQSHIIGEEHYGSGIGLHLAKEFANVMGGNITVDSEESKGAEFIVTIPLVKTAQEEYDVVEDKSYTDLNPSLDQLLEKPMILVVEDNEDIRSYLHTILSGTYEIKEAANGLEGKMMATRLLPDIIISDILMPEMNGVEMCIDLKKQILTKYIPIIMLTAKSADETKQEGLEAGADAYITKPFSEGVLTAQINRILLSREELKHHLLTEVLTTPQKFKDESPENEFLGKIVAIIEENLSDPEFDVNELSKKIAMSRMHLYRTFRTLIGHSPSDFIKDFRLQRAVDILLQKKYNINEIAYMTGFNDPKYFTINFKKKYGLTPSEYMRKND